MGCICEHRLASFRGPGSPRIVPATTRQREFRGSNPAPARLLGTFRRRFLPILVNKPSEPSGAARAWRKSRDTSARLLCGYKQRFGWEQLERQRRGGGGGGGGRREGGREEGRERGERRREEEEEEDARSCPSTPLLIDSPYAELKKQKKKTITKKNHTTTRRN